MTILMQEEQTVSFNSVSICYERPHWYEDLFLLYLLVILLMLVVRSARLYLSLSALQKLEAGERSGTSKHIWKRSETQAHSLFRFSILTFFITLLVGSISLIDIFSAARYEKTPSTGRTFLEIANKLPEFSIGMIVCIALYATGFFFESRFNRRRLSSDQGQGSEPLPPANKS
jgi:hypothetical protein